MGATAKISDAPNRDHGAGDIAVRGAAVDTEIGNVGIRHARCSRRRDRGQGEPDAFGAHRPRIRGGAVREQIAEARGRCARDVAIVASARLSRAAAPESKAGEMGRSEKPRNGNIADPRSTCAAPRTYCG